MRISQDSILGPLRGLRPLKEFDLTLDQRKSSLFYCSHAIVLKKTW